MTGKKVLIVMGSDSDIPQMEACFTQLESFGIAYEAHICSAHRTPERAAELAATAEENGFGVIIAAAGMAAHLPGVLAAFTVLPLIGVPLASGALNGVDALLAEVQMPPGIPVATVAINGSLNAAILACQILSMVSPELRARLHAYKEELKEKVRIKDEQLQDKLKTRQVN